MLRLNAYGDDRSRRATSARVLQRGAASDTGIAAQSMVQPVSGAPPG